MSSQKHSAELKAAGTVLIVGGGAVGVELAGKLPLLSVFLYLSVHLSVHLLLVCLSVCPSVRPSVCPPVCPSVCLSACLPACLPACVSSSTCLPACAPCLHSICLSLLVTPVWLLLAHLRCAVPFSLQTKGEHVPSQTEQETLGHLCLSAVTDTYSDVQACSS